jgi:hypothetical protein
MGLVRFDAAVQGEVGQVEPGINSCLNKGDGRDILFRRRVGQRVRRSGHGEKTKVGGKGKKIEVGTRFHKGSLAQLKEKGEAGKLKSRISLVRYRLRF